MSIQMEDDPRRYNCILLVGAEGCAELRDEPWFREPTETEAKLWRMELEEGPNGRTDVDALFVDMIGRPYWLMVVERTAPLDIWNLASSRLRVVRLTD